MLVYWRVTTINGILYPLLATISRYKIEKMAKLDRFGEKYAMSK